MLRQHFVLVGCCSLPKLVFNFALQGYSEPLKAIILIIWACIGDDPPWGTNSSSLQSGNSCYRNLVFIPTSPTTLPASLFLGRGPGLWGVTPLLNLFSMVVCPLLPFTEHLTEVEGKITLWASHTHLNASNWPWESHKDDTDGGGNWSWSYPCLIPREALDRLHLERVGVLSPVSPALWAKESLCTTVFAS